MENNMLKFTLDELNLIVKTLAISAQASRESEQSFRDAYGNNKLAAEYKAEAETTEKLIRKIKTATLA